ncbi:MAG: hypothetical protein ACLSIL_08695 [Enterococcus casseliflavus]
MTLINEQLIDKFSKIFSLNDQVNALPELRKEPSVDTKHRIEIFEEKGLSEKLSKQVNFQKDERKIANAYQLINKFKKEVKYLINSNNI